MTDILSKDVTYRHACKCVK